MKLPIRTSLLSALLVFTVALPGAALADRESRRDDNRRSGGSHDRGGGKRHSVPEFDIAAVGAIAAVIGAGGIVLARRRKT